MAPRARCVLLALALATPLATRADIGPSVRLDDDPAAGRLRVEVDGRPAATYVYRDPTIRRPYFSNVRIPGGPAVTRPNPPGPGDPADHPTMHPGVWLGFGDLGGSDFWRNKGTVEFVGFEEPPRGGPGSGGFAAALRYRSHDGRVVAREVCRVSVRARGARLTLDLQSTFTPESEPLVFGDQEEMGFGVRLATPLCPKQGHGGRLIDADGREGEPRIRGNSAAWCAAVGTIDGRTVALTIVAHPSNVRPSWWHARDYGLIVANPFGRAALTGGEASRVIVKPEESLTLRFGLVVDGGEPGRAPDPSDAAREFLETRPADRPREAQRSESR